MAERSRSPASVTRSLTQRRPCATSSPLADPTVRTWSRLCEPTSLRACGASRQTLCTARRGPPSCAETDRARIRYRRGDRARLSKVNASDLLASSRPTTCYRREQLRLSVSSHPLHPDRTELDRSVFGLPPCSRSGSRTALKAAHRPACQANGDRRNRPRTLQATSTAIGVVF